MPATRRSFLLTSLTTTMPLLARSDPGEIRRDQQNNVDQRSTSRKREVVVKGVPIHYEIHGSGKPMVMIHGFVVDRRSIMGCMEPVLARNSGWQRIYFDLPGMGQTPGSDLIAGSDDMLDVVLSFIDEVIPGQRFALVGQSYGGYLARGVLARRTERVDGMALLCPAIIADRPKGTCPSVP